MIFVPGEYDLTNPDAYPGATVAPSRKAPDMTPAPHEAAILADRNARGGDPVSVAWREGVDQPAVSHLSDGIGDSSHGCNQCRLRL